MKYFLFIAIIQIINQFMSNCTSLIRVPCKESFNVVAGLKIGNLDWVPYCRPDTVTADLNQ